MVRRKVPDDHAPGAGAPSGWPKAAITWRKVGTSSVSIVGETWDESDCDCAGAGDDRLRAGIGRDDRSAVPGGAVLAKAAAQQLDSRPGRRHRHRPLRPHLDRAPADLAERARARRGTESAGREVLRRRAAG